MDLLSDLHLKYNLFILSDANNSHISFCLNSIGISHFFKSTYTSPTTLSFFPWILIDNNPEISYNKKKSFKIISDLSFQYIQVTPWFGQIGCCLNGLDQKIEYNFKQLFRKDFL